MLWRIIFLLCIVFRDVTTTTNEFFMSKRMIINRSITLHCFLIKKFIKKIKGLILILPPPPPQKKRNGEILYRHRNGNESHIQKSQHRLMHVSSDNQIWRVT